MKQNSHCDHVTVSPHISTVWSVELIHLNKINESAGNHAEKIRRAIERMNEIMVEGSSDV